MILPLRFPPALSDWLGPVLRRIPQQDPIKVLEKLLDASKAVNHLRDKVRHHGMYEILDYDATLEIPDSKGKEAILTRREVIRFLQDNVVAVHDHAWGDGELFAKYQCQPGVPVDFHKGGSKHDVLSSLASGIRPNRPRKPFRVLPHSSGGWGVEWVGVANPSLRLSMSTQKAAAIARGSCGGLSTLFIISPLDPIQ